MGVKFCGWTHKWEDWEMPLHGKSYLVSSCSVCGKVKYCVEEKV